MAAGRRFQPGEVKPSVLEPEPLGAKTFGGVVMMFQLWLQSDTGIPCYKLKLASTRAFI